MPNQAFIEQLIAALRRHGESGEIVVLPSVDMLELRGPPQRRRSLPDVFKRWLRAADRDAIADANAVTDVDLDQTAITCCDGVVVLLCCPACRALWLHCDPHGHSWVDLTTTPRKLDRPRADKCPSCGKGLHFDAGLATFLPSRSEVFAADLARYLVT